MPVRNSGRGREQDQNAFAKVGCPWPVLLQYRKMTSKLAPLPDWVAPVAARISSLPSVGQELDQMTVNEYPPGTGLSPHVDAHLGLANAAYMNGL